MDEYLLDRLHICQFCVHLDWMIWALIMDLFFFLLLCITGIFLLESSHYGFCLVGYWIFYILINVIELYFGIHLSNIQTIWFFNGLFIRFITGDQVSKMWGHNFAPLLKLYPGILFITGFCCFVLFFILAGGKMSHSWLWVSLASFPSDCLSGPFPALGSFLTCMPSSGCENVS